MSKLNVYCVGLGKNQFEPHLFRTLVEMRKKICLKKLCDIDRERCALFYDRFEREGFKLDSREEVIETDFNKLVSQVSPSAKAPSLFIISTPPEWHAEMVEKCLHHKAHVYVDKPLSLSYEDGKRLVELADKYNRVIVVGCQRRFETVYRRLLRQVRGIHEITRLYAHSNGNFSKPNPKHPENNIVIGGGYHLLDICSWLFHETMGNTGDITLQTSILKKWTENPESTISFNSMFLFEDRKSIVFPFSISCSHSATRNSIDELIIVAGHTGETDENGYPLIKEVQFRRKTAPRDATPGTVEMTYYDKNSGETVWEVIQNKKGDKADRGAPLRQCIENLHAGTPEKITSTGQDTLYTISLMDQIINQSKTI